MLQCGQRANKLPINANIIPPMAINPKKSLFRKKSNKHPATPNKTNPIFPAKDFCWYF